MSRGMNKSQLIQAISDTTSFSKKDVSEVLAAFIKTVEHTLKKGGKVSLAGFGTYTLSSRPARTGMNPATKQKIRLQAITVARFRAGKNLKEQVRSVKIAH